MAIKPNNPFSVLLRILAVAVFLTGAITLFEAGGSVSVTSAYPVGNTPTPGHPQGGYRIDLPTIWVDNLRPPPNSYYMTNLTYSPAKNNAMYNLAFHLGVQDTQTTTVQDHLVILDFGYPIYKDTATAGTQFVFDFNNVFHPTSDIEQAVQQFAEGYFDGVGTNITDHLRIVVGTNNCCNGVSLSAYQGHGKAWANMMTEINALINNYSIQVDAVAGSDIAKVFSGPPTDPFETTQWLNYFAANTVLIPCNTQTTGKDQGCFYNYGTDSVSPDASPCATNSGADWHACDVWTVSFGYTQPGTSVPFARPLPEIYHSSGSDSNAWSALDAFSIGAAWNAPQYGAMYFVGSLTQSAMCGTQCPDGSNGFYANNSQSQGFTQLSSALNANPATSQTIPWSTDIGVQAP